MHNENNLIISKIKDKIKIFEKTNKINSTNFLEPVELAIVKSVLKEIPHTIFGGIEDSERNIIIIGTEDIQDFSTFISILEIESNFNLNHRDILGSILGLGIKRDIIGDIIINQNKANVFIIPEMQNYIIQNLQKIGKEKVNVKSISFNEIIKPAENFKEFITTVASCRLDAIISSAFGISRELSSKLVENDKVKLNYISVTNSSKKISQDDLISVRGYGRIILKSVIGETRKDRVKVEFRVFKN